MKVDGFTDEGICGQHAPLPNEEPLEVACGQDEIGADYVNFDVYDHPPE